MGIIRAVTSAVGGSLADQWLEVIEAENMSETTVMAPGVLMRRGDKRNQNKKGSDGIITDGSTIMISQNQFMLLSDGGKIVDFSAEPGYFTVKNGTAPSLFNGDFGEVLNDTFERIKYGGAAPFMQKVYYINTQEIKNIPFGTPNPINYFDGFYNAELFLRVHGFFSIRVVNPPLFFSEVVARNADRVDIRDINQLYLSEFLTALQSAISKMSVDGIRISHVGSKTQELSKYMSDVLDDEWTEKRGIRVESVGISSLGYDEESKKLINMRNQGAMLSDAAVREGYVQGSVARGIEAAGSNAAGSMQGFMGVGMGMQSGGGFMADVSRNNQEQMQRDTAVAADTWVCGACGEKSAGKFCANCGVARPENAGRFCSECGEKSSGKFCANCGAKLG